MIASDVTLRQWKYAEEENETLCSVTLPPDQSTTLEHSLSVTTTIFPLRTTLYICKKNLSTRACEPLRKHRLHVNSGQMWGDMRSRDAAGFSESLRLWDCWCLQLATQRTGTPECLVLLELRFPHFFVWCLVSSQGLCCFYMWCHGSLCALEISVDEFMMEFRVNQFIYSRLLKFFLHYIINCIGWALLF